MADKMQKTFMDTLQKAQELDVLGSGGVLILDDLAKECDAKIKKAKESIQRLSGQIDQLSFQRAMIMSMVQKYIRMEEDQKLREARIESMKEEEATKETPPKKTRKKKSTP